MNLSRHHLDVLQQAIDLLRQGFAELPTLGETPELDERSQQALMAVAERMHDNYPYHHGFYMGQMLKPPHPIAHLAYTLAMTMNPNNHALDGGRASSALEKLVVADIATMFGWKEFLGHLTSGGTMANLEALWVSRELMKDTAKQVVVAGEQSHYTHSRISGVLNMPFRSVAADSTGAMDVKALEKELAQGDVGLVVATLGTTLAGAIDPLPKILQLAEQYECRVHVDTAYGGYFILAENLDPHTRMAFDAIDQADSVVIDPHKHGLQPYGCGCVLFKDPSVGQIYQHDSPYTYFSSDDLHLGEISLECSRAGASAVALWTTMQALPLDRGGEFGSQLMQCRQAAMNFYQWLHENDNFTPLFGPQLDIVCWASTATTASETSRRSRELFDLAARYDVHLAVASVPKAMCVSLQGIQDWDQDHVDCLRACVMKPEHLGALAALCDKLNAAVAELNAQAADSETSG